MVEEKVEVVGLEKEVEMVGVVGHYNYTKGNFLTFYYIYRHFLHVTHFIVDQRQIVDNFAFNGNDTCRWVICGRVMCGWVICGRVMSNVWTGDE